MQQARAYLGGRWVPTEELRISIFDIGFLVGATVTERLRTFGGGIFRLDDHLDRMFHSLALVGIDLNLGKAEIAEIAVEAVERMRRDVDEDDDLGLSVFVTPGVDPVFADLADVEGNEPLLCATAYPLPFGTWARKYELGEAAAISRVMQTPSACLPPELKCRSRMHYYLADRQTSAEYDGARAILLDQEGAVSEATTANVVLYRKGEGLVSPPRTSILPGVSLAVLAELAESLGLPFVERVVTPGDLESADEILLLSTSVCILPVVRLANQPIGDGQPGPIYRRLLSAWSDLTGVDIQGQAQRFAER
jgi:branched-subunit amino acid aminotransferase/4-amino-4-deoxychorismate lyase